MELPANIAIFSAAVLFGTIGTFLARSVALRLGVVSQPNPIVPQVTRPVANLGGVGIFLGLSVVIGVVAGLEAAGLGSLLGIDGGGESQSGLEAGTTIGRLLGFAVPATLFLALGVVDDLKVLEPGPRFLLQVICASVAVGLGVFHSVTGFAMLDTLFSILWILVLVNAFHLTDVCDGLLAGVTAISLVVWASIDPLMAPFSLGLAGACAGFLFFNRPPASIVLGGAGSHLLGFSVAAITLWGGEAAESWTHLPKMALVAGVPLFELLFLVVVRTRKGLPWWGGSPDHVSMRLQAAGLSRLQTNLIAWSVAALLALAALMIETLPLPGQVALVTLAATGLGLCGRTLLRLEAQERLRMTTGRPRYGAGEA